MVIFFSLLYESDTKKHAQFLMVYLNQPLHTLMHGYIYLVFYALLRMALFHVHNSGILFTMPLGKDGKVLVHKQLLGLKFHFHIGITSIKREFYYNNGKLLEIILQFKHRNNDGGVSSH
jgi:hypothetical protein